MSPMADRHVNAELLAALRTDQRRRWDAGDCVRAEAYLQEHPTLGQVADHALELVYNEVVLRQERGESPQLEEYLQRFPQFAAQLKPLFELHQALESGSLANSHEDQTLISEILSERRATGPVGLPVIPGYEVLRELGRGGMAVVYLARQKSVNRQGAVKRLWAGESASRERIARLRQEAEAIGRMQHANIVAI